MSSAPAAGRSRLADFLATTQGRLTVLAVLGIALGLLFGLFGVDDPWAVLPYAVVVVMVGGPLVWQTMRGLLRREGGADLLATLAIVTGVLLGEWLVAAIIALMMAGGEALEATATRRASAVLDALARRTPQIAHRRSAAGIVDIPAAEAAVGDELVVLPHELCPVDGVVVEGHGSMDESYLTGEPYVVPKGPGSAVLSGAINGEVALTIRATAAAADSRYAQIVGVLQAAEQQRPRMRRLADRIGVWYTALAIAMGILGWAMAGDPERFLAVMVIATPCPLLIGVPVAIIGGISLAARNGIIVKNPAMLEEVGRAETVLFDKTGTLTYGRPVLTEVIAAPGIDPDEAVLLAGAAEEYSRHPLAPPILAAARELGRLPEVDHVAEEPGLGLRAVVAGRDLLVTSRRHAVAADPDALLPGTGSGLEAIVLLDGRYAATLRFRDEPRVGAAKFVGHLDPRHGVQRTVIISGDRESEVRYLADRVGIDEVFAGISPEGKLDLVRTETSRARTLFLGDGINDAPAMTAATVGVAFGQNSDITAEAADAVVLDSSLERLDELLHIGERMRRIALQSALGGIGVSLVGMVLAVLGLLPPVAGAALQEAIDVLAVLNAARVPALRRPMTDFVQHPAAAETVATHR